MSNPVTIDAPAGVPYIDITREFDAPVEALFRAHSDPELFAQWVGPAGYEMELDEFDFRSGGHYRYVHRSPDGGEYAFRGVFHVVRENEFAIQTFEWEGLPDVVSIESMRFESLPDGRSRLSGHSVYPNQEARDGMVENGMEQGVVQGFEKLDGVLAS
jgi:uncharacterized protein YndB with AHSA1/START domain